MSQVNHNECWIPVRDLPNTERGVIIWTKRLWGEAHSTVVSRHLDFGAWYDAKEKRWLHSDGSLVEEGVTHWMEMPVRPS